MAQGVDNALHPDALVPSSRTLDAESEASKIWPRSLRQGPPGPLGCPSRHRAVHFAKIGAPCDSAELEARPQVGRSIGGMMDSLCSVSLPMGCSWSHPSSLDEPPCGEE